MRSDRPNMDQPRIETARLILRLPRIEDFDGYAELHADEEAARHIGGALPRAAAWRKFLQMPGAWMVQGFGMFSVSTRRAASGSDNAGRGFRKAGPEPRSAGRSGVAPGARVTRTRRQSRPSTGRSRIWAGHEVIHSISPENTPSQALARRLGSRLLRQSPLPEPYADHIVDVWGQSREEWRSHRAART